jgi:hypothetical protein
MQLRGDVVMTFYSVILFVHVAGALALSMALGLEWTSLRRLQYSGNIEQIRAWGNVSAAVQPLSIFATLAILLPGVYLAAKMASWSQAWIQISTGATLLIGAAAGAVTAPRMRAIRSACAAGNGEVSAVLRVRLSDPFLWASLQFRVALALGVVFLMTTRPELGGALAVIAAALVVGLVASLIGRNRRAVLRTTA